MHNFDYEILDLGLVYYKNIVKDPENLIKIIEQLDKKITETPQSIQSTSARPWIPWQYNKGNETLQFCLQKFIPQVGDIKTDDIYRDEQLTISSELFGALEKTLLHYSSVLYPFAEKNIKSREKTMHLLKYEDDGYLPAHQDQGVSTRVLSVLLYLNNDYEGGEITFQNSNITIKPEPGSILFFPSNFLYVHEVAPITKGPRYALPNWYHNVTQESFRNSTGEE